SSILSAPVFCTVLDVEPTADSNTIRDQYNKLSSLFHPDGNRASSREAFKLVTDAFGFLFDKALRQNYNGKVDLEILENMRTFWTACCTCRVLHQFERKSAILSAPIFCAVLDVEPTADSNTIRDQYNKLSSLFHPEGNRPLSREAFKLVTVAFGVLSDKALRQNYNGKVDLEIRENMRTFWTACCTCRVLHQFER
ncbi:hypothetical protein RYX36_025768, partial [Vicia faba]